MGSRSAVIAVSWLLFLARAAADDCPPPDDEYSRYLRTDRFAVIAESASGAAGDVVAVPISVLIGVDDGEFHSLSIAVSHDPAVVELVGIPDFTPDILGMAMAINPLPVEEGSGQPGDHAGHGFLVYLNTWPNDYAARFPSDVPMPLLVAYYRLKGSPGDTCRVAPSDGVLARGIQRCWLNELTVYDRSYPENPYRHYLSTANVPATLTVLEGPATHPDRPPGPPEAKVYPEEPTDEQVNFTVEISEASGSPGQTEVPVEVYVTTGVEYSAIEIPIDFDERYLRLARAEDHFVAGTVLIDNRDEEEGAQAAEGNAVVFSGFGVWKLRLAGEGERVHAATLWFDVLPAAAEIESTELDVVGFTAPWGASYPPWVSVYYETGVGSDVQEVTENIPPIAITKGRFSVIHGAAMVPRGDATSDGTLDISDPIAVLADLFLGAPPPACPAAGDFNLDATVDISDPIAMLTFLFRESTGGLDPEEVPCR
jgi:hypothetical protein